MRESETQFQAEHSLLARRFPIDPKQNHRYIDQSNAFSEFHQKPLSRLGWFFSKATASEHWTAVSGTVTGSKVRQVTDVVSGYHSRGYHFEPGITYEYTLNNKTYTQSDVSFPNPHFYFDYEAQRYVDQYKRDSVKVYYDVKDPERSCLNNGVTDSLKKNIFWMADESHNNEN